MKEKIKGIFLEMGADVCGVAGIERFNEAPVGFHPWDIYKDCKSVITFGKALPKGLLNVGPEIVYNHYKELSMKELDRISYLAALAIEQMGIKAVPLPSNTPYEFWDENESEGRGLISIKHAAVLCGLGSQGKSTLLINEKYGNMLQLGVLLTDMELESDPMVEDLCLKNCRLCIENCPAGAITNTGVIQKKCRSNSIGKNKKGFDICSCNTCRKICPKNNT